MNQKGMSCQYRILSCDGGGVRGIISVRLLQRLLKTQPDLLDRVDLFAGTSTGAIIGVGLANGMTIDQIFDLYYHQSKKIFHRSILRRLGFQIFAAKYTNKGIRKVLNGAFGDSTLRGLQKKVLVSALDLDAYDSNGRRSYKPKFFHNLVGQDDCELDLKLADILAATTAAPTFFPTFGGFVDGGLVANNPSVAAIAQALDPKTEPYVSLDKICLMSIGTGKVSTYVPGNNRDWGFLRWATIIVELMMNGSVDVTDYECRHLLKGNYTRVNPYLDEDFRLDSVEHLDRMVEAADSYDITRHVEWLNTHF